MPISLIFNAKINHMIIQNQKMGGTFYFNIYHGWVDAGLHSGMAYLASERHLSARRCVISKV